MFLKGLQKYNNPTLYCIKTIGLNYIVWLNKQTMFIQTAVLSYLIHNQSYKFPEKYYIVILHYLTSIKIIYKITTKTFQNVKH